MSKKILDLSTHNGYVDFNKVKKAEIYGIIQRMGYGQSYIDPTANRNIDKALSLGLKVGAYWFIYAYTKEDAIKEADFFNKCLLRYKGKLELPVFADYEYDSERYANQMGVNLTKSLRTEIVKAFCNRLEEYGWYVGNYYNVDYYQNKWYQKELDRFDLWIADWRMSPNKEIIKKSGIWQYTSTGRVDGVNGNVDINIIYKDYPSIIREYGLNGFKKKNNIKSNDELADEVLKGLWGNGDKRRFNLIKAGYNYEEVQKLVNEKHKRKDINRIARDVIQGKFGNGLTRKRKLEALGYDYLEVQKEVNKLI